MIRIGIIGMGVISHYYVAAFDRADGCRLAAVCDLNTSKLKPYEARGVTAYSDYRQLLDDPNVDAVIINLPNNLHYTACLAALEAGKHVCCEKPLTLDLAQAEHLSQRSRELNSTLLTAFHRRYNSHVLEAAAQSRFEHQVRAVRAHYDERIEDHAGSDTWYLNPSACGGGCIADNGPNVFDTLSFAFGKLTLLDVKVRLNDAGIDMEAEITLRSERGIPITALLSWDYPHGERKDIVIETIDGETIEVDFLRGYSAFKSSLYHEYEGILSDFCNAISTGGTYGDTGVDAVRLVKECYARLPLAKAA